MSDYLGTPIQMYDAQGNNTWDCTLDIYGKVLAVDKGTEFDCPFRFQGQYEDAETGLYYNRFRYYDPNFGGYISQDPIGLEGDNTTIYGFLENPNIYIDILGLKRGPRTGAFRTLPERNGYTLHHIIPDALREHPLLIELNYDINNIKNLIYLPNSDKMNSPRTIHLKRGRHVKRYFNTAEKKLDKIYLLNASPEIKQMQLDTFIDNMRKRYMINDPRVKLNKH
ncbi:hypothetical protein DXC34_18430 [Bacteroides stercoris]|uniref:Teneurin-like YD-shell domain-containing protein n=1 Tax=Bacteroides stercoris TaxID=46506 RepID=A0A3E4UGK9_BACSE|nr:hypothetical protein DXC34_18430 [Bacteroides stercoris]